jgi:hypothetical protein
VRWPVLCSTGVQYPPEGRSKRAAGWTWRLALIARLSISIPMWMTALPNQETDSWPLPGVTSIRVSKSPASSHMKLCSNNDLPDRSRRPQLAVSDALRQTRTRKSTMGHGTCKATHLCTGPEDQRPIEHERVYSTIMDVRVAYTGPIYDI